MGGRVSVCAGSDQRKRMLKELEDKQSVASRDGDGYEKPEDQWSCKRSPDILAK